MKSLKKQRRIQIVAISMVALLGVFAVLAFLPKDAFQFFRSPTEVAEAPPAPTEVFRIGGLVEEGSLVRGEGEAITFNVTDGNAVIRVTYTGILPDLFEENQGMVGLGTYDGTLFTATEILAKHDEDYMPKEVVDALKEQGVYQQPDGS